MTKILFVCSANVDRSPTAHRIYTDYPGIEAKSAGTSWYAHVRITKELVQWADVILCMENWQKHFVEREFSDLISNKKVDFLDIPDDYVYMNPALIELIKEKVDPWLSRYNEKIINFEN